MDSRRLQTARIGRAWLAAGALVLALVGGWAWQRAGRRDGSLQGRLEMYQEAMENVRSRCVPPAAGLDGYCRDHATLLLDYPECDAECVALVRQIRGEPTR